MADLVRGCRIGPWIVFRDEDGLRHAVRQTAVLTISDADEGGESSAITMTGGRQAVVRQAFDTVLGWLR